MGRLITETNFSEVTATLERLDEFGVTTDGLKRIRTMSPALLKQMAHIFEWGISRQSPVLPGLWTFDVCLDSRDTDLVQQKMTKEKVFQSIFVVRDVLQKSSELPVVDKKFIVLTPKDFGNDTWKAIENFSSQSWLTIWSEKNLLGPYRIALCDRFDAAIHIALAMDHINCPRRMILVCGKRSDWITIDANGRDASREKEVHNAKVDFSYDCPALFELRKV